MANCCMHQWLTAKQSNSSGPLDPEKETPAKAGTMVGADLGYNVSVAASLNNNNTFQLIDAIIANTLANRSIEKDVG
jgi:hypothetical protein